NLLGTAEETSAARSNETNLLTRRGKARHRRSMTNVLMVTTSVRMVNGIHGHTADLWPAVALGLVLVVGTASLQQRLVNTTTTGDETNHGAALGRDELLGARGQLDARSAIIHIVPNDGGIIARAARNGTTIAS